MPTPTILNCNLGTMARTAVAAVSLAVSGGAVAASCTPDADSQLKVVDVASDDTLNIRSGASTDYDVVAVARPSQENILYQNDYYFQEWRCQAACRAVEAGSPESTSEASDIMAQCIKRGVLWLEVQMPNGVIGWASARFLAPISPQTGLLEESGLPSTTVLPPVGETIVVPSKSSTPVTLEEAQSVPNALEIANALLDLHGLYICHELGHLPNPIWTAIRLRQEVRVRRLDISGKGEEIMNRALTQSGKYLENYLYFEDDDATNERLCQLRVAAAK